MTVGIWEYNVSELRAQLNGVIATGAFRFILLVDAANRFVAYISATDGSYLFTEHADAVVTAINEDRRDVLSGYSGIIFSTHTTEDTTLDALVTMREQNLDMLPILNQDGMVHGVATWNQLLTSMMLELATTTAD
jgi:CBS-domain-containing membrane protein